MTAANGIFANLLGNAFQALHAEVQRTHDGRAHVLEGTATVLRGKSLAARLLCAFAGMPKAQHLGRAVVHIVPTALGETWSRHFGDSAALTSKLSIRKQQLVESMGPIRLRFAPVVRDAGIDWQMQGIAALGIPLPRRCFAVSAWSGTRDGRYYFEVDVTAAFVGRLIRYEGFLTRVS